MDTSVLKRLGHSEVRRVIEPLAARGELGRPTICDLEVGYSARNALEWDRLVGALDAFQPIDTTARHVHRALQVQRLLAERSQRGRKIPDLLVAAAAEELASFGPPLRRRFRPHLGRHGPAQPMGRPSG